MTWITAKANANYRIENLQSISVCGGHLSGGMRTSDANKRVLDGQAQDGSEGVGDRHGELLPNVSL